MEELKANNLFKTFRRGQEEVGALRDVSIRVARGEVVALLGRSGSGKTTLLNCLLGWDAPDRGSVSVTGATTPARAPWRVLAVVPQQFGLLAELTILDNVAVFADLAGRPDPRAAAMHELSVLGLAQLADRFPTDVSLGEQQRTAIARALVDNPAFLVADEPTSRLDEVASSHVLTVLRERAATNGSGILIASHDSAVMAAADRCVVLEDGRLVSESV